MKISMAMVVISAFFGLAVIVKCTPDVIASECGLAIIAASVCVVLDK